MAEPIKKACGCDAPAMLDRLVPVEDAIRIARELAVPVGDLETRQLGEAIGRVAARDICAGRAMPFFDNSAMDGFAVRLAGLNGKGPWRLPVLGTIAAGAYPQAVEEKAGAYRIFTGAPLPHGFDAVVMQELCQLTGQDVIIRAMPEKGENVRYGGEDVAEGDVLVPAGTMLEPRHVGLLAASGVQHVEVTRKIRIAILSSGDELRRNGPFDSRACIYDANAPMLQALCAELMLDTCDLGALPDDFTMMTEMLRSIAGRYDLVISTGAASTGAKDMLRDALHAAGGHVIARRVALKPGKPVFFGTLGTSLYTGLPGNPLAAFVGFHLFVRGQIEALAGLRKRTLPGERAVLGCTLRREPGRAEYMPVRVTGQIGNLPVIEVIGHGSSASLYPLVLADGMALVPPECGHIESGNVLAWQPFSRRQSVFGG